MGSDMAMGKRYVIASGDRTKVFRVFSSSIPSTINFNAIAAKGEISGTVEVDRWHWFSWQKETLPLARENAIAKGFADADFMIHVTPDQDCEVVFTGKTAGRSTGLWVILLVAVIIVAAAVAMIALSAAP